MAMERLVKIVFALFLLVLVPRAGRTTPPTFANGFTSNGPTTLNQGASFKGSLYLQTIADPSAPSVTANTTGVASHTYYIVGHDGAAACGSGFEGHSNVSAGTTISNSASPPNNAITLPTTYLYYDVLKDLTTTSLATCVLNGSVVTDIGQATAVYSPPVANTTGGVNISNLTITSLVTNNLSANGTISLNGTTGDGSDAVSNVNVNNVVNILTYGKASNNSTQTLSGTATASNATVPLSGGAADFIAKQWVYAPALGPTCGSQTNSACATPTAPTVANAGNSVAPGAVTHNYQFAAEDSYGGWTVTSPATAFATAPASLTVDNFDKVTHARLGNQYRYIAVYCDGAFVGTASNERVTSSTGLVEFDDTSCTAQTPPVGVPATPPVATVPDFFTARITAISASSMTLSVAPTQSGAATFYHDDAPMINAAIAANGAVNHVVEIPGQGTYEIRDRVKIPANALLITLHGEGAILQSYLADSTIQIGDMFATSQRPELIKIEGLRVQGAMPTSPSLSEAAGAVWEGQNGIESDEGIILDLTNGSVQLVGGVGIVIIKSAAEPIAEQNHLIAWENRYTGLECMQVGAFGSSVDDIRVDPSVLNNNCGLLAVGYSNTSSENAAVFLRAGSIVLGGEISAVHNGSLSDLNNGGTSQNGFIAAAVVRAGTAQFDNLHFENNTNHQTAGVDLFIDTDEYFASIVAPNFNETQTVGATQTGARTGVKIRGNAMVTGGEYACTAGGANPMDVLVDANASAPIHVDIGHIIPSAATCAVNTAYVTKSATNTFGVIAAQPDNARRLILDTTNSKPIAIGSLPGTCTAGDYLVVNNWNATDGVCTAGAPNISTTAVCAAGNVWNCP